MTHCVTHCVTHSWSVFKFNIYLLDFSSANFLLFISHRSAAYRSYVQPITAFQPYNYSAIMPANQQFVAPTAPMVPPGYNDEFQLIKVETNENGSPIGKNFQLILYA